MTGYSDATVWTLFGLCFSVGLGGYWLIGEVLHLRARAVEAQRERQEIRDDVALWARWQAREVKRIEERIGGTGKGGGTG